MKIYVLGDSISIHYGPYLEALLRGTIGYARKGGEDEALQDLDFPRGANAGDSDNVRSFLERLASAGGMDADLLLINCGLHDIRRQPDCAARQVPLERYEENLKAVAALVGTMKPGLIWIRTTPCDEKVHNKPGMSFHRFAADCKAYNQAADRIMQAAGVPSIDLYGFTRNLGDGVYCDHVHFHEWVRREQAAFIAGWLAGYLQAQGTLPGRG